MKKLAEYNVVALDSQEKQNANGGRKFPWGPLGVILYVIDEIYEGWTRECTSSCNHK